MSAFTTSCQPSATSCSYDEAIDSQNLKWKSEMIPNGHLIEDEGVGNMVLSGDSKYDIEINRHD